MATTAVISDTHIPDRATAIPEVFRERIGAADHVIHAGDFTAEGTLDRITALAGGAERLTAVSGNMDRRPLDLPAVATADLGGRTFVVTHGTGSPHDYAARVASTVRDHAGADAIGVAGHTHEVLDTVVEGVRLLNPGSVTGASPARRATMFTVEVEEGDIDVSLHEA